MTRASVLRIALTRLYELRQASQQDTKSEDEDFFESVIRMCIARAPDDNVEIPVDEEILNSWNRTIALVNRIEDIEEAKK